MNPVIVLLVGLALYAITMVNFIRLKNFSPKEQQIYGKKFILSGIFDVFLGTFLVVSAIVMFVRA